MHTDEYIVDTAAVRSFIHRVHQELAQTAPAEALAALSNDFVALLADQTWLPDAYRCPAEQSGMGGGIAT